ncbi:MAG: AI-2E family transporter, partial [bacterium]
PPTLQPRAGLTCRILIILAGFAALFFLLGQISLVLVALFLAAFFTALASPIMSVLRRKLHLHKVIAMILAILLIAIAVVVVLTIVIRSIVMEAPQLAASFNQSIDQLETFLSQPPFNINDQDFNNYLTQVENWGKTLAVDIGSSALGSVGDLVLGGSVFIFGVIFFMMTPNTIWGWVVSWVPTRARPYVNTSGELAWDSLSGYTRGVVVVALCDSILVFIGLMILQVPMAPALAAIVFFGAFIPVIGAPIATFFAAIVALAERGPIIALCVVGLTIVVGSFDGDVLQPLVMGKAVSLNPLAIIILIAMGSILLGIIGALVAVPIGAAVYRVLKYLTDRDPEHPLPGRSPPDDATPEDSTPGDSEAPAAEGATPPADAAGDVTTSAATSQG